MSEIKTNKLSSLTGTNNDITIDPDGTGDTIIASGNVGIGTASPSETLHVEEATTGNAVRVSKGGNYIVMGGSGSGTQYVKGFEGNVAFGNVFDGNTLLLTGDTERMRIDASGRVLTFKTTSGLTNAGVEHNFTNAGGYFGVTSEANPVYINRAPSDGSLIQFRQNNNAEGSISVSGTTVSKMLLSKALL